MKVSVNTEDGKEITISVRVLEISFPGRRIEHHTVDPYTGRLLKAKSRKALSAKLERSGKRHNYRMDWAPYNEELKSELEKEKIDV